MVEGDRFRHRRHPDQIAARPLHHLDLGGCLVARSKEPCVDAFSVRYRCALERSLEETAETSRVDLAHVGESGTESIVVQAEERVPRRVVEVIADRDEIAGGEAVAETSGGIREEDRRGSGKSGGPGAEHDLVEIPTLIRVNTPGEEQHGPISDRCREETPAVTDDPWFGEEGNLRVRNLSRIVERSGVVAQAGPEHNGGLMALPSGSLGDRGGSFL